MRDDAVGSNDYTGVCERDGYGNAKTEAQKEKGRPAKAAAALNWRKTMSLLLIVVSAVVVATCLIYLVSLVDRLADAAGRNSERLKDMQDSVDAIKHALNIMDNKDN
jgi:hypothetical protein